MDFSDLGDQQTNPPQKSRFDFSDLGDTGAPATPSAPRPGLFSAALSAVKNSPAYSTSPQGLLEQVPALLSKGAHRVGQFVSEQLAKPQFIKVPDWVPGVGGKTFDSGSMDPRAAAAVGTAISMGPDVAMAGSMPAEETPAMAQRAPGFLERIGTAGVNNSAGITPRTIMKMSGDANPATAASRIGRSLVEEGAFGNSPAETFDKASAVKEAFGQKVEAALQNIRNSGQPTTMDAQAALQPLVDKWTSLKDSALQGNRALAKPFEEIYGKLAQSAQSTGGQMTLDSLRDAMQETGQALSRSAKGTPREAAYSELYATLAQARDGMIRTIAQQAGDPKLANDLLTANEGYSRYSRIMPDIQRAAAASGVSQFPLFSPVKGAVQAIQPILSKAAVKLGGPTGANLGPLGAVGSEAANERLPMNSAPPLALFQENRPKPDVYAAPSPMIEAIQRALGIGPPPIPPEGTPVMTRPAPPIRPLFQKHKKVARVIGPVQTASTRG